VTAQAPDTIRVDGTEWAVVGIDGQGLFDPAAWGLQPIPLSTAEWRGFVARYVVEDDRLRLAHLSIGLAGDAAAAAIDRLPGVLTSTGDRARWSIDFDRFDVPFTGTLLLGQGFIQDLYVHMGFHPAWKWERVIRLQLKDGLVTASTDESARMAIERERRKGERLDPGPDADPATVGRWIRDAFDRSIRRFGNRDEPGVRIEGPDGD
jgi:hypothetical protein